MSTKKIEKYIQASPSEVFPYFTNSTALKDWLCDVATCDPRMGGRLYMWWNGDYYTSGEYISIEKDKAVSFTWFGRGEPHATRVDVTLKNKKSGTLVKLVHRKIGNNQKWKAIGDTYEKEWINALDNLTSVLENGADLRISRRPMLGINIDEFSATIAEKIGVPVVEGLRLGGVIDGLGAQNAGLKADDVITEIDGQRITGASTFGTFIENKHAGDTIEVTFYRCSDKKTVKMVLSGRPLPPTPVSGTELSSMVESMYKRLENEIEDIYKEANEKECAKKPGPSEWSANEVLAHLIHDERGWQNAISDIIGGHEAAYDDWGGNIQAHIDATVASYPEKDILLKVLIALDSETLKFLANIPAEFLTHRGRFWKLVFTAIQRPYHIQSHIDQIKAAIQTARIN